MDFQYKNFEIVPIEIEISISKQRHFEISRFPDLEMEIPRWKEVTADACTPLSCSLLHLVNQIRGGYNMRFKGDLDFV
jgi:hypothetical protein